MDMNYLVSGIRATQPNLRLRQAEVVAINADHTIDVIIAGDSAVLPSVRYLSIFAPLVGYHVWIIVDKADILAIGYVARADKSLAPRAYCTAPQQVAANTRTAVAFQAADSDEWGCWSPSQPTRLTAPLNGRYIAVAATRWLEASSNAAWFSNSIVVNGGQEVAHGDVSKFRSDGQYVSITSPPITLTRGDYFEMLVECSAASELMVAAGGSYPSLSAIYLGC